MKNYVVRKRIILFALTLALCLCSALFVTSLGLTASADEVTTYEFVGIKPEDSQTLSDNFYAYTTTQEQDFGVTDSWEVWYSGSAKQYDASEKTTKDITVNFRVVTSKQNRELFFTGLVAEAGDIITVGGVCNIDHFESTYAGSVEVGDYVLKLAQTSFMWDGTSWGFEKETVDDKPTSNVFLDMNGSDASVYGNYVRFNTDVQGWFGSTPDYVAAGVNVQACFPAGEDKDIVTIGLGKKYKAENFSTVRVQVLIPISDGTVDTTISAYKTADSTEVAGSKSLTAQATILLEVDASKIADSEGYIDSFVIKRTGTLGGYFFDYVELVPLVEKVDTKPTDNMVLDVDGKEAWVVQNNIKLSDSVHILDDTYASIFAGADGSTKITMTDGVAVDGTVTVNLAKKYKAENFSAVRMRLVVGSWGGTVDSAVTSVYATTDTTFANVAGSVTTANDANAEIILEIDASKIAVDGYIDSFVIKRTGISGQLFIDYVELVPAKEKVDEKSTASVFLDANGTDMWLIGNYITVDDDTKNNNWWDFFTPSDTNVKVSYPANDMEVDETVKVHLSKKYKASNFYTITVNMIIGADSDTTVSAYASSTSTEVAGSVSAASTKVVLLEIDPSKIADSEGYFDSFIIKRTTKGQLFFDYVELIPADPLSDDKYVSTGYFGGLADANDNWTEKLTSVNGWKDTTGNVTMSYAMTIVSDADAKNGYAYQMYFHSWYGTVSSNAIIFNRAITTDEASEGLVIRIKAHLSPNGKTYNTTLGGIRLYALDSDGSEGEGYMIPATITQDKFISLCLTAEEAAALANADGKIYGIQIGAAEQVNDANSDSFHLANNGAGPNGCVAYIEIDYIELRKEITVTYNNATADGEQKTAKSVTGFGADVIYLETEDTETKQFFAWSSSETLELSNIFDFSSDLDGDVTLYGWWIDISTDSTYYGVYRNADKTKSITVSSLGVELVGYGEYEKAILSNDGKVYIKKDSGSEIVSLSDTSLTKTDVVEISFNVFGKEVAKKALAVGDTIDYTSAPDGYTFTKWVNATGTDVTTASKDSTTLTAVCARVEISADSYAEYLGKYLNRTTGDLLELKANNEATITFANGTTKNITYYLLVNGGFAYIDGDVETPCTFDANRVLVSTDVEYAKLQSYTVTFYVDGTANSTATVNSGDYKATKPEDPTKEGFVFDGWYTAMEGGELYNFDAPVYDNISLYARFSEKTVVPDEPAKKKGCKGSIDELSGILAMLTVVATVVVLKKKHEKD